MRADKMQTGGAAPVGLAAERMVKFVPLWFLLVFAGLAVTGVVLRLLTVGRRSRNGSWSDVVLVLLGAVGLAYHCGAMFFRHSFTGPLAVDGYARHVAALGTASIIGFAVPAALVLLGVRGIGVVYTALAAAALAAVGVTMYDGGALDAHLGAIMAAAVVLIGGVAAFLPLPGQRDTHGPSSSTVPAQA